MKLVHVVVLIPGQTLIAVRAMPPGSTTGHMSKEKNRRSSVGQS